MLKNSSWWEDINDTEHAEQVSAVFQVLEKERVAGTHLSHLDVVSEDWI